MLCLLVVLQPLDYSLEATPNTLAVCSLRDKETNVGLLNFGDCDRQEMVLLNQRVSVSQSCFLCAQIALKQYHELPNIDCSTPESLEKNITRTARREVFNIVARCNSDG